MGRTRLLVAKLVSVVAYTLLAVLAVSAVAYVVGTQLFGSGPLPSTSGTTLSTGDATLRTVLAVLYVGWSMLGVAAIALFFSTLYRLAAGRCPGGGRGARHVRRAGRARGAASVQPYLPTRYWLAFVDLFRDPVLYRDLVRGTALQAVYIAVFLGGGLGELHHQGHHRASADLRAGRGQGRGAQRLQDDRADDAELSAAGRG